MDKIRFKGKQIKTMIRGAVMFQADELVEEISLFLKEQHAFEKKKKETDPEYALYFDVELKRWYKRRSLSANNLQWELCTRLAAADNITKEFVHNSVKEVFYPREEYHGIFVPKDGSELTTVEYAKVIEALVIWCVDRTDPIDIYDIWILFTEWRFGQERDPLEGQYADKDDYKEKHPCCEACGKFLLVTDNYGVRKHLGQLAHIVSLGAGGIDKDVNWILLGPECHIGNPEGAPAQHQVGWGPLLEKSPWIRKKVDRAREICGKKPIDQDPGQAVQAAEKPLVEETEEVKALRETKENGSLPWPKDNDRIIEQPETLDDSNRSAKEEQEFLEGVQPQAEAEPVNRQAEIVKQVFSGEVQQSQLPAPQPSEEASGEDEKQKMIDRIDSMERNAADRRQKYYPKNDPDQQGLFDEKPEKFDPKKAQYRDDDDLPDPEPAYKDGEFSVPADF